MQVFSDIVKLELLEKHCLPVLLYAIESTNLNTSQLQEINSWWNSVFRKIFGYNKWESVKELICLLERLDIWHMVNLRQLLFLKQLSGSSNSTLMKLMSQYCQGPEIKVVQDRYKIDISWSVGKMKARAFMSFKTYALRA